MEKISLKLKNCYGISELNQDFVFQENDCNIISIYAPNGTMKSSLAKTISDIINSDKYEKSKDKITKNNEYERNIIFNNKKIENIKNEVLVLNSFQAEEKNLVASILLVVDEQIKNEYKAKLEDYLELKKELFRNIYLKIENKKRTTKQDYINILTKKIGTIFQQKPELILIENNYEKNLSLINIKQDLNIIKSVFENSDLTLIFSSDFKEKIINKNLLETFIEYMEILKKSSKESDFFRGSISFHKSKIYSDNKDIVSLFKDWKLEHKNINININSKEEFDYLYEKEREKILKNLNKKEEFIKLNKNILSKNNEDVLENFDNLKLLNIINEIGYEDLEKLYYLNVIEEEKNSIDWKEDYSEFLNKEKEIIKNAKEKITLLEKVIDDFNNKFDIPIYIKLDNREDYIIGKKEEDISLKLVHKDNENFEDEKHIYSTLSTGQKKALYLLKTLFKIEELKFKNKDKDKECLIVIDDLSESFDYKNKNALLSYIYDLNLINNFKILSMTHNFDFFRSLSKRLNIGKNKYIATRNNNEIKIFNYKQNLSFKSFYNGINSIESFFLSIPILRESIEEKENKNEIDILTKSLHYKKSTLNLKNKDILNLEVIKKAIKEESIIDNIREQNYIETLNNITKKIISDEINDNNIKNYIFSNKIILCIAIRIKAEEILKEEMNLELNDDKNQLGTLFKEYQNFDNKNINIEKKIQEAVLSVPELIHFNSEDYLMIIDLSFDYLKNIYLSLI